MSLLSCYYTEIEMEKERINTLGYIGEKSNNRNILWAVGALILLSCYGLAEEPMIWIF